MMTTDDIILVSARLTEAHIILGRVLVQRHHNLENGTSMPTLVL